jgi:hypothetical protein
VLESTDIQGSSRYGRNPGACSCIACHVGNGNPGHRMDHLYDDELGGMRGSRYSSDCDIDWEDTHDDVSYSFCCGRRGKGHTVLVHLQLIGWNHLLLQLRKGYTCCDCTGVENDSVGMCRM